MPTSKNPSLRTYILTNIGFYSLLLILNFIIFITSPIFYIILKSVKKHSSGQAVRRIIWIYGALWITLATFFTKLEINTKNAEDYPSPSIIVVNHQSFFDAFCMGALPIYNIVFLVRSWPFRIPFYGHYMRIAGYINSENKSCEEFVREAQEKLKQGISVIIFPEGTRSNNGQLGRFYSGSFKLAMESKIPIVPICIDGTGKFLPKGKFFVKPNPITITKLNCIEPIQFENYGQRAHIELKKAVKQKFIEALESS